MPIYSKHREDYYKIRWKNVAEPRTDKATPRHQRGEYVRELNGQSLRKKPAEKPPAFYQGPLAKLAYVFVNPVGMFAWFIMVYCLQSRFAGNAWRGFRVFLHLLVFVAFLCFAFFLFQLDTPFHRILFRPPWSMEYEVYFILIASFVCIIWSVAVQFSAQVNAIEFGEATGFPHYVGTLIVRNE